jgi:hypothetical protein
VDIIFSPKSIGRFFLVIVIILIAAHLVGVFFTLVLRHDYLYGVVPFFDLNGERNFPAMYSAVSMIICAAFLGLIGFVKRKQRQPYARHWLFFGVVFLYLAVDEFLQLHDKLHAPMVRWLHLHGLLFVGWVVPYAVAGLILAAVYFNFVRRLPRRTLILFLTAGIVYVTGAAVIEAVSGRHLEQFGIDSTYVLTYTVEEMLELFGILIFIYALASYIDRELKDLRIRITSSPSN